MFYLNLFYTLRTIFTHKTTNSISNTKFLESCPVLRVDALLVMSLDMHIFHRKKTSCAEIVSAFGVIVLLSRYTLLNALRSAENIVSVWFNGKEWTHSTRARVLSSGLATTVTSELCDRGG